MTHQSVRLTASSNAAVVRSMSFIKGTTKLQLNISDNVNFPYSLFYVSGCLSCSRYTTLIWCWWWSRQTVTALDSMLLSLLRQRRSNISFKNVQMMKKQQEQACLWFRTENVLLNSCTHNATVKCNRMKSQKIRRRPESCHAYHPHVSHVHPDGFILKMVFRDMIK